MFNPLVTGPDYFRVLHSSFNSTLQSAFKHFICDIKQRNLNNFHSLEIVDHFSETQLQVGKNYN